MVLRNKKGAIEVQFNWIFVMIAGSLILVFFFGVVQKQRELSDIKIANTLLTTLESIATGAGVSRGTAQAVPMPRVGIDFGCSEECTCEYGIKQVSKDYEDKVMFSPSHLEGSNIIFWTLDWNVPFRVTNFVYATNSDAKYFFVYQSPPSNFVRFINKSIPEQINARFVNINEYQQVENKNYPSAKFVFIETAPTASGQNLLGIDSSFSRIDVGGIAISQNSLTFYDKTSRRSLTFVQKSSGYYQEAALFGAIFADDWNMYECNMVKAVGRLDKVSELYYERTKRLNEDNNDLTIGGFCQPGYNENPFDDIRTEAGEALDNMGAIGDMQGPASELESQNEALLRMSCPLIY